MNLKTASEMDLVLWLTPGRLWRRTAENLVDAAAASLVLLRDRCKVRLTEDMVMAFMDLDRLNSMLRDSQRYPEFHRSDEANNVRAILATMPGYQAGAATQSPETTHHFNLVCIEIRKMVEDPALKTRFFLLHGPRAIT